MLKIGFVGLFAAFIIVCRCDRTRKGDWEKISNLSQFEFIKRRKMLLNTADRIPYRRGTKRTTAVDWRQLFNCLFHTLRLF